MTLSTESRPIWIRFNDLEAACARGHTRHAGNHFLGCDSTPEE